MVTLGRGQPSGRNRRDVSDEERRSWREAFSRYEASDEQLKVGRSRGILKGSAIRGTDKISAGFKGDWSDTVHMCMVLSPMEEVASTVPSLTTVPRARFLQSEHEEPNSPSDTYRLRQIKGSEGLLPVS